MSRRPTCQVHRKKRERGGKSCTAGGKPDFKKAYHKLRPYTTTKETQKAMIMAHYNPQLKYFENWNKPPNDSFELVFGFGSITT